MQALAGVVPVKVTGIGRSVGVELAVEQPPRNLMARPGHIVWDVRMLDGPLLRGNLVVTLLSREIASPVFCKAL